MPDEVQLASGAMHSTVFMPFQPDASRRPRQQRRQQQQQEGADIPGPTHRDPLVLLQRHLQLLYLLQGEASAATAPLWLLLTAGCC